MEFEEQIVAEVVVDKMADKMSATSATAAAFASKLKVAVAAKIERREDGSVKVRLPFRVD